MANRERGEYRLQVRDRSFTLVLTLAVVADLEDRSGLEFPDLVAQSNDGSVTALRWILWATLQERHRVVVSSVEDAGRLMDAIGGPAASVGVLAAFLARNVDTEAPPPKPGRLAAQTKRSWRALYLDARSLGLTPDAFWSLTLRELWLEVAATRQRFDRDVTMAWQMAVLSRTKEIPTLASLLSTSGTAQSGQDLVHAMATIADLYGLKLKVERKAMH